MDKVGANAFVSIAVSWKTISAVPLVQHTTLSCCATASKKKRTNSNARRPTKNKGIQKQACLLPRCSLPECIVSFPPDLALFRASSSRLQTTVQSSLTSWPSQRQWVRGLTAISPLLGWLHLPAPSSCCWERGTPACPSLQMSPRNMRL